MEKHLRPLITVNSAGDKSTTALRKSSFYQGLRICSASHTLNIYHGNKLPPHFLFRSSHAACADFKGNSERARCFLIQQSNKLFACTSLFLSSVIAFASVVCRFVLCVCVCVWGWVRASLPLQSAISIIGDCHLSSAVRPVIERLSPRLPLCLLGWIFSSNDTAPPPNPPPLPRNAFCQHNRAMMKYYKPPALSVLLAKLWQADTKEPRVHADASAHISPTCCIHCTAKLHTHDSHQTISDGARLSWRDIFVGLGGCCETRVCVRSWKTGNGVRRAPLRLLTLMLFHI